MASLAPASPPTASKPLVSIFCFCKNHHTGIRRCLDSILAQSYPNLECVVQDGASTDGTLEILREYGNRIRLESAPDSCAQEGFFRALRRCRGDLIGSCQSDEALFPHAAQWAVTHFEEFPRHGAIYGDTLLTDAPGFPREVKPGSESFSAAHYLLREAHMEFVSVFLRRSALEEIGLHTRTWNPKCSEFEFLARLSLKFPVQKIPGLLGQYAVSERGLSQSPTAVMDLGTGMQEFLTALAGEQETPPEIRQIIPCARAAWNLRAAAVLLRLGKVDEALVFFKNAAPVDSPPREFLRIRRRFIQLGVRTGLPSPVGPALRRARTWLAGSESK